MASITDRELAEDVDGALTRVRAGEVLTITGDGRPVARMRRPGEGRQWISAEDARSVWAGPAPQNWDPWQPAERP